MSLAPDPKTKPSRRRLDKESWELLLEKFRETPGKANAVAKRAGVDRRTALKAWEVGLPYDFAQRPIKEIIAEEQAAARARLGAVAAAAKAPGDMPAPAPPGATLTADERRDAKADAVSTRTQEASLVRFARGNVAALLGATANLVKGAVALSKPINIALSTQQAIDPDKGLRMIREIANITRLSAQAGASVMEMERLLLGDPTMLSESDMSLDDAIKELVEASSALDRARARGMDLKVIEGGGG